MAGRSHVEGWWGCGWGVVQGGVNVVGWGGRARWAILMSIKTDPSCQETVHLM